MHVENVLKMNKNVEGNKHLSNIDWEFKAGMKQDFRVFAQCILKLVKSKYTEKDHVKWEKELNFLRVNELLKKVIKM